MIVGAESLAGMKASVAWSTVPYLIPVANSLLPNFRVQYSHLINLTSIRSDS